MYPWRYHYTPPMPQPHQSRAAADDPAPKPAPGERLPEVSLDALLVLLDADRRRYGATIHLLARRVYPDLSDYVRGQRLTALKTVMNRLVRRGLAAYGPTMKAWSITDAGRRHVAEVARTRASRAGA